MWLEVIKLRYEHLYDFLIIFERKKKLLVEQGRLHGRQMRPPHHDFTRLFPCRPSLVTPFSAPFSPLTLPHSPLTIPCPYPSSEVKNTHFRVLGKKNGLRTNGQTNGRMERPSCRDARTHQIFRYQQIFVLINAFNQRSKRHLAFITFFLYLYFYEKRNDEVTDVACRRDMSRGNE